VITMTEAELKNIKSEFDSLANYLLESTEDLFKANLSSLRDFCSSNEIICNILKPISQTDFSGIEYFSKKLNPKYRYQRIANPKNNYEVLKVSYDVLYADTGPGHMTNYALGTLYPSTKKVDEVLKIGTKHIFGKLINYINLELTKLINNEHKSPITNQFNINTANGSIIGSSQNATINNSYNLDEIKKIIDEKISDANDKQQLQDLVKSLKAIIENDLPVRKGALSKFGDVLTKYSWVTGPIAKSLISWAVGK
jgi:hypothetical protein